VRPESGVTWGMSVGEIDATAEKALKVQEAERFKGFLDKQWLSSTRLGDLSPLLLPIPQWEVIQLSYGQHLYKSPAWPVGPRESCTVTLKLRHSKTGALRVVQRSIDLPGCEPPSGYTRVSLICGGYALEPTSATSCRMAYVNMVDPNGSIPKAVVRRTVPERCLAIARVRKCCAEA